MLLRCERSQESVIEQNSYYVKGHILWTRSICDTSKKQSVACAALVVKWERPGYLAFPLDVPRPKSGHEVSCEATR